MSLRKIIEDFCIKMPDAISANIARAIVDEVDDEQFIVLLTFEIDNFRRNHVRELEKTAFAQVFDISRAGVGPLAVDNLRRVFLEKFALGNKTFVTWGRATISEHRTRIEYLKVLRGGIDETIKRHEEAIRLIEMHNATCLDEIEHVA